MLIAYSEFLLPATQKHTNVNSGISALPPISLSMPSSRLLGGLPLSIIHV